VCIRRDVGIPPHDVYTTMSLTTRHSNTRFLQRSKSASVAYLLFLLLLVQPLSPVFAGEEHGTTTEPITIDTLPEDTSDEPPPDTSATEKEQNGSPPEKGADNDADDGVQSEHSSGTPADSQLEDPDVHEPGTSENSSTSTRTVDTADESSPPPVVRDATSTRTESARSSGSVTSTSTDDRPSSTETVSVGADTADASTTPSSDGVVRGAASSTGEEGDLSDSGSSTTPSAPGSDPPQDTSDSHAPDNGSATTANTNTASTTEHTSTPLSGDAADDLSDAETETGTDDTRSRTERTENNENTGSSDESTQHASSSATSTSSTHASRTPMEKETTVTHVSGSYVVNDENRYQFGVNDCVTVGDGSFYCSDEKEGAVPAEDKLYASLDADGDSEIYMRKDGVTHQITDNEYDDRAPYYDPAGDQLVWHALINDRYQIMSYDLTNGEMSQLTDTGYNNMEPAAFDGVIVWQAWIKDNWEIVRFDGDTFVQLSDNAGHDVSPHIQEDFIMWQTQRGSQWRVSVYDRSTENIEVIEGGARTELANPRLLLVYESTDENGDVHTLGYDFERKETVPLGTQPSELPDDLPDPDQTGETRALIQNKPSSEEEFVEQDTDGDGTGTASSSKKTPRHAGTSTPATGSSTDEKTLMVPPLEHSERSTTSDSTHASSSKGAPHQRATSTEHIDDVVIPQ